MTSASESVCSPDFGERAGRSTPAGEGCPHVRCLTDGGLLLFTAPFVRTSPSTIQRARLSGSGEIEHLLPPEYHGDPMNPDGGILCFQHFGWDVIEALKAAGFTEPHALFMWSRRLGYLGDEQVLFSARKMPRS